MNHGNFFFVYFGMSSASISLLTQTIAELSPAMQQEVLRYIAYLQQRVNTIDFSTGDLDLPGYDQPLDLSQYRVELKDLEPIRDLWANEPDAEVLCSDLTA